MMGKSIIEVQLFFETIFYLSTFFILNKKMGHKVMEFTSQFSLRNDKDGLADCHFDKMCDENHLPGHIKI